MSELPFLEQPRKPVFANSRGKLIIDLAFPCDENWDQSYKFISTPKIEPQPGPQREHKTIPARVATPTAATRGPEIKQTNPFLEVSAETGVPRPVDKDASIPLAKTLAVVAGLAASAIIFRNRGA